MTPEQKQIIKDAITSGMWTATIASLSDTIEKGREANARLEIENARLKEIEKAARGWHDAIALVPRIDTKTASQDELKACSVALDVVDAAELKLHAILSLPLDGTDVCAWTMSLGMWVTGCGDYPIDEAKDSK